MAKAKHRKHPQLTDQTIFTGDNLHVLRGIDNGSIDLIYLDPPFNSNRDYAAPIGSEAAGAHFKDRWTLNDLKVEEVGLLAEINEPLAELIRAAGLTSGKGVQAYLTYMANRLIEMHRVLKDTGTLLLHCDDTMNHLLRLTLEGIFGPNHFLSTITWQRQTARAQGKGSGRIADTILCIAKDSTRSTYHTQFQPWTKDKIKQQYSSEDQHGPYSTKSMIAPGTRQGESGLPWRKIDPNKIGSGGHWVAKTAIPQHIRETMPTNYEQLSVHKKLDELDKAGLIQWSKNGNPRFKHYLSESKGIPISNIITHILPLQAQSKEKTGYPTQKPVALLQLLIEAFSNPDDMVLDPFCGCATTCIAAEDTSRRWCGIDLSPLAVKIVQKRLAKEVSLFTGKVAVRDDIPSRTDHTLPPAITQKQILYGEQEGRCSGCRIHFQFRNLTIDHVVPRTQGGTNHPNNLQLLCAACNSVKGGSRHGLLTGQTKGRGNPLKHTHAHCYFRN